MGPLFNGPHTAQWTPAVQPAGEVVTGYKIYWHDGSTGFVNTQVRDVGNVVQYDLNGLDLSSGSYTIAVTAYDAVGSESVLSSTAPFAPIIPNTPTGLKVS